jgi:hypothetical protein
MGAIVGRVVNLFRDVTRHTSVCAARVLRAQKYRDACGLRFFLKVGFGTVFLHVRLQALRIPVGRVRASY